MHNHEIPSALYKNEQQYCLNHSISSDENELYTLTGHFIRQTYLQSSQFRSSIRKESKGAFENSMIDGSKWTFKKLLIYQDSPIQPCLGFTGNGFKKIQYTVSGSSEGKNALLICEHTRKLNIKQMGNNSRRPQCHLLCTKST